MGEAGSMNGWIVGWSEGLLDGMLWLVFVVDGLMD